MRGIARNGGVVANEDDSESCLWFFCSGRQDPWVKRYDPMNVVLFSADWVTTCVRERLPVSVSRFVLHDDTDEDDSTTGDLHEDDTAIDLSGQTLVDIEVMETDLGLLKDLFNSKPLSAPLESTPSRPTRPEAPSNHKFSSKTFLPSVSTSTRRPFYSIHPGRSSSPLTKMMPPGQASLPPLGEAESDDSDMDQEDEMQVSQMLLSTRPYLLSDIWDNLQIKDTLANGIYPTFSVSATLDALEEVSLANVALFEPGKNHPDLGLPFVCLDPGKKMTHRRSCTRKTHPTNQF